MLVIPEAYVKGLTAPNHCTDKLPISITKILPLGG